MNRRFLTDLVILATLALVVGLALWLMTRHWAGAAAGPLVAGALKLDYRKTIDFISAALRRHSKGTQAMNISDIFAGLDLSTLASNSEQAAETALHHLIGKSTVIAGNPALQAALDKISDGSVEALVALFHLSSISRIVNNLESEAGAVLSGWSAKYPALAPLIAPLQAEVARLAPAAK